MISPAGQVLGAATLYLTLSPRPPFREPAWHGGGQVLCGEVGSTKHVFVHGLAPLGILLTRLLPKPLNSCGSVPLKGSN